jgi:formate/nitrite transporter FocA (FNT family)
MSTSLDSVSATDGSGRDDVITLMTWLIAVGGFTHIVAGSMEAYLLVLAGDWAWWQVIVQFIPPVLIGNIIGGTALFALIAYAQVMDEI